MVNEEIIGGLKSSIAKGESLKQAMISFYNSGYKKEEIEEAARALKSAPPAAITPPQVLQPGQPQIQQQPQQVIKPAQPQPIQQLITPQIISAYGQKKSKMRVLTIVLIVILVLLLISLTLIFVFKDALVGLLNKLF